MKAQRIKTNFIFQIAYQAIILIVPLIMSPILTRRLGSNGLGIHSFVNGIAYFFVMIANLGIVKYGQRCISSTRTDEEEMSRNFWSLFAVHFVFSFIVLCSYVAYVFAFTSTDIIIYVINIIYVASAIFDVTWLFYGLENFRIVLLINMILKTISLVMVIILVQTSNDLWVFTLIECCVFIISNLFLLGFALKIVKKTRFSSKDCVKHIKPLLILSIPVMASTLYSVFDKVLIGLMLDVDSVAFYEYSNRIINIPKSFVIVISNVLFPRICHFESVGEYEKRDQYVSYGYIVLSFISFASIFGILAIGNLFAVEYYGEEFAICGLLIMCLVPLVYIIGLGDVIKNSYILPQKKEKYEVIVTCVNSVLNISFSALFIPFVGIIGAVIGTLIAEIVGLSLIIWFSRKNLQFKYIGKSFAIFSVVGSLMFLVVYFSGKFMNDSLVKLLILFVIGAVTYSILSILASIIFYKRDISLLFKKRKEDDSTSLN